MQFRGIHSPSLVGSRRCMSSAAAASRRDIDVSVTMPANDSGAPFRAASLLIDELFSHLLYSYSQIGIWQLLVQSDQMIRFPENIVCFMARACC